MSNLGSDHMLLAIDAASKAINELAVTQGADNDPELWYDDATVALKAAEPHFRAMIAQEILSYLDNFSSNELPYRHGVYAGIQSAAQIAKGN